MPNGKTRGVSPAFPRMRQTPPSSVRKCTSSDQLSIGTRRSLVFEMPDKFPVQVTSMMALEPERDLGMCGHVTAHLPCDKTSYEAGEEGARSSIASSARLRY